MPLLDIGKSLLGAGTDLAAGFGAEVLQEALEWLLGGVQAAITLKLIKFLVQIELPIGESLAEVTAPMIGIGGFFLVVGLITSMGDGYREVVAGTDTGPRVIGQVIFRVIGLALLLGAWYWIVPLAVNVANGMTDYVLSDAAVGSALRRTFATELVFIAKYPMLALITAIALAIATLVMMVLKFIITLSFACIYVGGPALIGFGALPRIGASSISMITRGLVTLTLIPFLWTVIFAAWAGVSAGLFDTLTGDGNVASALMAPGLFLAGLVMMIGATKKAFSMASFGISMSGGTQILRMAAGMAAFQGMKAAMLSYGLSRAGGGGGGNAGGAGGTGGGQPPNPGGNGGGLRGRVANSPTAQKAQGNFRRLLDLTSGASAIQQQRDHQSQQQTMSDAKRRAEQESRDGALQERSQNERKVQEARSVAQKEHSDRLTQERSAAIAKVVGNGEFAHRTISSADEDSTKDAAALRETARQTRETNPVTQEKLKEAQQNLPVADRAAMGNLASASLEGNSREEAGARFERRMAAEYGGMEMTESQRSAVETVISANPQDVKDVFAKDVETFSAKSGPGFDEDLFRKDLDNTKQRLHQERFGPGQNGGG